MIFTKRDIIVNPYVCVDPFLKEDDEIILNSTKYSVFFDRIELCLITENCSLKNGTLTY